MKQIWGHSVITWQQKLRFLLLTYSFACYACNTLKNFNILFLIFSPLCLIEFFISTRFSIEVKHWKRNLNNLNKKKQTNKQTNKKFKKNIKPCFWNNWIWDPLYFHIITFPWKNIYEGVPFYKICRHAACNWWLSNENDKRLGSKLSLRPISLVL